MMDDPSPRGEPATLAELHLPPTFVADHAIRTLANNGGAMSPADLAHHWRIPESLACEISDSLKAAGIAAVEAGQGAFELLARIHLTSKGESRIDVARRRTWYAGPLPVSLSDATAGMQQSEPHLDRLALQRGLRALALPAPAIDGLGQATLAAAPVSLTGVAYDEQSSIVEALEGAIDGRIEIPYAIFTSGSVMRMFDGRWHRGQSVEPADDGGVALDILRSRIESLSQWVPMSPPVVSLRGGIRPSDVVPAFDEEARFYVAPAPASAHGGILAVMDAATSPDGLHDLARDWLIPGRDSCGVMVLRTGERIELAWRATTLLMSEEPLEFAGSEAVIAYPIDVSALGAGEIRPFLMRRLDGNETLADEVATALDAAGEVTRASAARVAKSIRDRLGYEGKSFRMSAGVIDEAIRAA